MQLLLQIPSSVVFIIILYAVVSLAASSFTSHGGEWGLISMVMAFDAGTAPLPCRTSSCITLDNVSQICKDICKYSPVYYLYDVAHMMCSFYAKQKIR